MAVDGISFIFSFLLARFLFLCAGQVEEKNKEIVSSYAQRSSSKKCNLSHNVWPSASREQRSVTTWPRPSHCVNTLLEEEKTLSFCIPFLSFLLLGGYLIKIKERRNLLSAQHRKEKGIRKCVRSSVHSLRSCILARIGSEGLDFVHR